MAECDVCAHGVVFVLRMRNQTIVATEKTHAPNVAMLRLTNMA